MNAPHPDKQIIESLGGPTEVARKLGLDPAKGAVQRIQNWMTRGIPARVRLDHLDVFGPQPDKRDAA
jgi:hypothetical protein